MMTSRTDDELTSAPERYLIRTVMGQKLSLPRKILLLQCYQPKYAAITEAKRTLCVITATAQRTQATSSLVD